MSYVFSPPILSRINSDTYIGPMGLANQTVALAANTLYVVPVFVGAGGTATKIGIRVTTGASGNARLGIYTNVNSRPGTLILDAGTVTTANTNSNEEITISQALPSFTWIWLALVANATPTIRALGECEPVLGYPDPTHTNSRLDRSFDYAALPANESAQSYTFRNAVNPPFIWVRG